jgi:hypothetical protein
MRLASSFRLAFVVLLAVAPQAHPQRSVTLIAAQPGPPPPGLLAQYPAVLTHTHNWRFPDGQPHTAADFDQAERNLVAWCARLGIRAVGVGSAWDPANDAMFQRFEGPDRDLYYSGRFPKKSVMQTADIQHLLGWLNQLSAGRTFFYLDNETPKTRYGHVWWFNYHYDAPAWNDYSQDRPIHFYRDDPHVEINPLTGQPHTRRNLFQIMAIQHRAGALGVFAHPTRWWITDGHFVTNIAALSGLFLVANGSLDGLAIMGDHPFDKPYQDLWFSYLDTGVRVPGFAETDFFLNLAPTHTRQQTPLNYMHLDGAPVTAQTIRDVARSGNVFASNGAFLTLAVDDVPMGSVLRTTPGQTHHLVVHAYPRAGSTFSLIQIIGKHGRVLAQQRDFPGGVLRYTFTADSGTSYVLARAFGPGDNPVSAPAAVRQAAVTNPVYLYPPDFHTSPATTRCTLRVPASSPWIGGAIQFQQTDGRVIETRTVTAGIIRITLPANARILLHKRGRPDWLFYIAMENDKVEDLIDYLTSGRFRRDYPNLPQGDVPPAAFRLNDLRQALSTFDYTLTQTMPARHTRP